MPFTILLHSSKTMRPLSRDNDAPYQQPRFINEARKLSQELKLLSSSDLQKLMSLSQTKATETLTRINEWNELESGSRPAIDAFLGDIYSGLQVHTFSSKDRLYANNHLLILSGLYGVLRALDSIQPYRLEMGYKLSSEVGGDLYQYWGAHLRDCIPSHNTIINLSAVEYTKAILPHLNNVVITPKFMTLHPKTHQPTFVTVHAKVARGAFAHWLIVNRIDDISHLRNFNEIGYIYDDTESTPEVPVYVCKKFGGIGLSVRLT